MKIAVFLPNWLGDVAMATPALRAMRRHFGPDARMVGILRPYLADVLAGTSWLDEQWFFDPRSNDRLRRAAAIARRMRAEKFDMAVLMTNSFRTAWLAWRSGAEQRIGYVRYGRGPLLTGKLYPRRAGRHIVPTPMVEAYLELARAVGCGEESPRLELATVEADERSADAVFERLGLHGDGRVIALNSSGAYGGSKLWPVEYFAELARRILAELDHDVLVVCGPKERDIARRIVALSAGSVNCGAGVSPALAAGTAAPQGGRVVSMADQPMDLGTAKACIRRCRLMVSTDSGPRHVAAAFGLPLVTVFGPMLPIWSENPTQRAVNLVLDLDCIGCHKRVCPLGHHRCMRDLTVDMVFAAAVSLL
ncbi:MAG: lipopolysaccharide heptosyltransferase II [Thermoguttaceae bacterium]|jgi:heptosyltransferase-2